MREHANGRRARSPRRHRRSVIALLVAVIGALLTAAPAGGQAPPPDVLPLAWARRAGDQNLQVREVVITGAGETILGGFYTGGASRLRTTTGWVDLPADAGGHGQAFVARFAPDDTLLGVQTIGSATGDDSITHLAAIPNGDVAVIMTLSGSIPLATVPPTASLAGTVLARVAPDGGVRWAVRAHAGDVSGITADSTRISVAGTYLDPDNWLAQDEGWATSHDLDGAEVWSLGLSSLGDNELTGIVAAGGGAVVITGTTTNGAFAPAPAIPVHSGGTGFAARVSAAGAYEWATGLPVAAASSTGAPVLDATGQLYVTGTGGGDPVTFAGVNGPVTVDTTPGGHYLVSLDPAGGVRWADELHTVGSHLPELAASGSEVTAVDILPTQVDVTLELHRWSASGTHLWSQQGTQPGGILTIAPERWDTAVAPTGALTIVGLITPTPVTFGSSAEAVTLDPVAEPGGATDRSFVARWGSPAGSRHDLSLQVDVSSLNVVQGTTVTVDVTVTNAGPSVAAGARVEGVLADELVASSAAASQGSFAGEDWQVGDLAPGASASLVVEATPAASAACAVQWTTFVEAATIADADETDNAVVSQVIVAPAAGADPDVAWTEILGGDGAWQDEVLTADAAADGGVVAAGRFNGTATFGTGAAERTLTTTQVKPGYRDTFVTRYDGAGVLVDLVHLVGDVDTLDIEALPDGGWLVAGTYASAVRVEDPGGDTAMLPYPGVSGGLFVARFTGTGDVVWVRNGRSLSTSNSFSNQLGGVVVEGDRVVLVGAGDLLRFTTTAGTFTAADYGFVFAQWDLDGGIVSVVFDSIEAPGSTDQRLTAVTSLAGGDIAIAGSFRQTITIGSGASARTVTSGSAGDHGFAARLDPTTGIPDWAIDTVVGTGSTVIDVARTPTGGIAVAGPGNSAGRVSTYTGDGTLAWTHTVSTAGTVTPRRVGVDAFGRVVVAGQMAGSTTFVTGVGTTTTVVPEGTDVFVERLAPTGTFGRLWTPTGRGNEYAAALAQHPDGGFAVGGLAHSFQQQTSGPGTLAFGNRLACLRGGGDGYLAAYHDPVTGLRGTVLGPDAGPADGVTVTVMNQWPSHTVAATTVTGPDGTYAVAGLAPGTYRVRYVDFRGRFARQWWTNASTYASATDIVVGADGVTVADASLSAAPGGRIGGRVLAPGGEPANDVVVQIYSDDGFVGSARTGPQGYYGFGGLWPDTYYARVVDPQGRWAARWWRNAPTGFQRTPIIINAGPLLVFHQLV